MEIEERRTGDRQDRGKSSQARRARQRLSTPATPALQARPNPAIL